MPPAAPKRSLRHEAGSRPGRGVTFGLSAQRPGLYGGRAPVRPRASTPPDCGGSLGGLWAQEAHADHPPVLVDALERVSAQLQLGHDGGREVNPAGVQLRKGDGLSAGLMESLEQPLLLGVGETGDQKARSGRWPRRCA
jgi:hypothetical protein